MYRVTPTCDLMIEGAKRNNVKLEVAENYYRTPMERLKANVIDAGLNGDVSRLYRIFYEGGYHGMNVLRTHARGNPKSVMGVGHTTPIVPITDRMKRHHELERWNIHGRTNILQRGPRSLPWARPDRDLPDRWDQGGHRGRRVQGFVAPSSYVEI